MVILKVEKNVSENMKSYSKMILNYIVYQYINNTCSLQNKFNFNPGTSVGICAIGNFA